MQLVDEKHQFVIGNAGLSSAVRDLQSISKEAGFHPEDLNHKDKQNWDGCQRIFSQRCLGALMEKIMAGDERMIPTFAYVSMGFRLMRAWLGEANGASTDQIITDAAFALSFALFWRDWVLDSCHRRTRDSILDT